MHRLRKILPIPFLLPIFAFAQISPKSLDFGIDGFYFTSPLTIALGGNSIEGKYQELKLNGQLGIFVHNNLAIGFRYRGDFSYFNVERQFFNSQTGAYQAYEQTDKANVYGLYARYYLDFSKHISAFVHGELGAGSELIRVTEKNANGGVDLVDYHRSLEDQAIGFGLAFRPQSSVGIEITALRRGRYETYAPAMSGTSLLQTETYLGTEFRIGLRLNFDVLGFAKGEEKELFVPRF